jgi:hypothetical protein
MSVGAMIGIIVAEKKNIPFFSLVEIEDTPLKNNTCS